MEANCLFCQIVAGQKPADKIYEDEQFLAFLDKYPFGPGHTLVIPKAHYRWVWDVPNIGAYMETTRKLALHLSRVMKTETVYTYIFGEQVSHAHIHLVPPLYKAQPQGRMSMSQQEAQALRDRLILR